MLTAPAEIRLQDKTLLSPVPVLSIDLDGISPHVHYSHLLYSPERRTDENKKFVSSVAYVIRDLGSL